MFIVPNSRLILSAVMSDAIAPNRASDFEGGYQFYKHLAPNGAKNLVSTIRGSGWVNAEGVR